MPRSVPEVTFAKSLPSREFCLPVSKNPFLGREIFTMLGIFACSRKTCRFSDVLGKRPRVGLRIKGSRCPQRRLNRLQPREKSP